MDKSRTTDLLQAAVDVFGSQAKLGRAIGFSQHAVWAAITRGIVSPRMARAIHAATDGKIRKEELCPEIFAAD